MKKRILAVIAAAMFTLPALGACGCSSLDSLSFSGAAVGSDVKPGYSEKCVYSVTYEDSSDYYKKDDSVTDDYLKFVIGSVPDGAPENTAPAGTYTTLLEVSSFNAQNFETDIVPYEGALVYKLTTELSLPVRYVTADGEFSRTDYIRSESFFYSNAFAPICSNTRSSYTCVYIDESNGAKTARLRILDSYSSISYNEKSYKVITDFTYYGFDKDNDADRPSVDNDNRTENFSEKTFEYESKTVIDNADLLFALRNVNVEESKSVNIPVVAANYGEYQTLSVTNKANNSKDVTVKVNGEEKSERINVMNLSYSINSQNKSGTSQKVVVQTSGSSVPDRALLLEYAEPLIAQGSPVKVGTLVYRLTEVSFSDSAA